MRFFIEHDAAMLARMAGHSQPHYDGLIAAHRKLDDILATTMRSNPLGDHWLLDLDSPGDRTVSWSGTLADDIFEAHPATWMRPGRDAFAEFCREVGPQLESRGRTLCFQPHSRHVLSDVQSCVNFLREHEGGPFEIALSPATLLEPSMLPDLDDHLERMFGTLGERCSMVMLNDARVERSHDEQHERCEPVGLGEGIIPMNRLRELVRTQVPDKTPIVLNPQNLEHQIALLTG